jgi:Phytanoyl-CoA dioxygenase (PhyH)
VRLLKRRPEPDQEIPQTRGELLAAIEELTRANRRRPKRKAERRLLALRHHAGAHVLDESPSDPEFVAPATDLASGGDGLPDIAAADLTPELIRAGILRDGCLLVRGLVDRAAALSFAEQIDRAFAERVREDGPDEGYYEEFHPDERFNEVERSWIAHGGGLLAADSPLLAFQMMELFDQAGLSELVQGYLGEPAVISVDKTTLRKAEPSVGGAWHQDGAFMGPVRSLNLWLSLSRCGDEAPGLDLVPRRLDGLVTTRTDEAMLDFQVSQRAAEEAAGDKPIVRPIFEPGDALFFDELFLHKTGSEPSMPKPRYAVENWFFAGSSFPADYAPIAV